MKYKEDIDKVRERLYAFWDREIVDRACVCVLAPKKKGDHISMFENPHDLRKDPAALKAYWTDPETIYRENIARLERTWMGGDVLPVIFQNYGTSGHCNYYGARPVYGNDTIWFDPVWDSLAAVSYTHLTLPTKLEV